MLAPIHLAGGTRPVGSAPKRRAYARCELAWAERLRYVVVRADIESPDSIALARARGQHDDRQCREALPAAQDAADLDPVESRKVEVEDDDVRYALGRFRERRFSGMGDFNVDIAGALERVLDEPRHVRLILDDEHAPPARAGARRHPRIASGSHVEVGACNNGSTVSTHRARVIGRGVAAVTRGLNVSYR